MQSGSCHSDFDQKEVRVIGRDPKLETAAEVNPALFRGDGSFTEFLQGPVRISRSDTASLTLTKSSKLEGRQIKYGVVASILLHLIVFGWFVRALELQPQKSLLKPGEEITAVRLIEQPSTERLDEPAPNHATAISDRNHSTAAEKIPKLPSNINAPLGRIDVEQQRIIASIPPTAPDIPSPPNQETKKEAARTKDIESHKTRTSVKSPQQNSQQPQRPQKPRRSLHPDLNPTQRERDIAIGLSPYAGSPDFSPDGDADEAVVDINTREEKFFSYLLHLKQKIQGVWVYPSSAANAGIGGALTVEFSIARNGELVSVNLVDSSGHTILDESAIRAIKVAAPYFPFPSRMRAKRLKIRANFVYVTGNYFRRIL